MKVGCGYFEWYDGPMGERAKILLNELKEERKMLLAEKMEHSGMRMSNLDDDVAELWSELSELKKAWVMKAEELRSAKNKFNVACIAAIIPWILFLYIVVFG